MAGKKQNFTVFTAQVNVYLGSKICKILFSPYSVETRKGKETGDNHYTGLNNQQREQSLKLQLNQYSEFRLEEDGTGVAQIRETRSMIGRAAVLVLGYD